MNVINTCLKESFPFSEKAFSLEAWTDYIDTLLPNSSACFLSEIADYDFERQCLPVIQNALRSHEKWQETLSSFATVTEGLHEKIQAIFHRTLDADLILYMGLCNGAGWVTEIGGRIVVLLGIEKIIELDWCSVCDMYGLIYHELGHVYQAQYGVLERQCATSADEFLWQLFIEGIAMCFEQELIGDANFYHQDQNGWKSFMDDHIMQLKHDFAADLAVMDRHTQRYFGDWADYQGYGDAGYYLGTQFVRFILKGHAFDEIISFDLSKVREQFAAFLQT